MGNFDLARLEKIGINTKNGLTFAMEDEEFYLEILGDYLSDFSKKVSDLRGEYEKEDWKNYEVTIHSVKSTSKTVGADGVADFALRLEKAAENGDSAFIHENHGEFLGVYGKLVEEAKQALGE